MVSSFAVLLAGLESVSVTEVTVAVLVVVPVAATAPTVMVTVSVSVAPFGRFPMDQIPVPLANLVVPEPTAHTSGQPVGNPATKASVLATPVALDGPLLVAVTV